MNTPSRRIHAYLTASMMALALAATSQPAAAGDEASGFRSDPSCHPTERVIAKLSERIESQTAADVADDLRTLSATPSSPTRVAEASPPVERGAAAHGRTRTALEERADEHTRVYIAIREQSNNGVLVQ
jgi:hypothetical protein